MNWICHLFRRWTEPCFPFRKAGSKTPRRTGEMTGNRFWYLTVKNTMCRAIRINTNRTPDKRAKDRRCVFCCAPKMRLLVRLLNARLTPAIRGSWFWDMIPDKSRDAPMALNAAVSMIMDKTNLRVCKEMGLSFFNCCMSIPSAIRICCVR